MFIPWQIRLPFMWMVWVVVSFLDQDSPLMARGYASEHMNYISWCDPMPSLIAVNISPSQ
jgi:hypothetical protein